MSVVIETTLGDMTVDLYIQRRPEACQNFLKLCKMKYYNYNLFHTITRNFIAQTGDPTGSRNGGESIHGVIEGPLKRYFEAETSPKIKHTTVGLISFVGTPHMSTNLIGSQFFVTLGDELMYLDQNHCVFGEVVEGLDVIELLNEVICDNDNRPYQDVRITHTSVLDDPFPDPPGFIEPTRSPSPSAERLQGGRIAPDEEIDETVGKSLGEIEELVADREAKARATILEMVGDIPDAEIAPPENVLFVCKLNPVTNDDDLEIIFSRFGVIKTCEVIRDKKTGNSLQYAFIEFEDKKSCEDAYFKMDNVLIDDKRIHVDFSQSVAKIRWHGKGRGVTHFDDKGRRTNDSDNDIGKGRYKKYGDKARFDIRNWKQFPERGDRNWRREDRKYERSTYYSSKRYRSPSPRRNRKKEVSFEEKRRKDDDRKRRKKYKKKESESDSSDHSSKKKKSKKSKKKKKSKSSTSDSN